MTLEPKLLVRLTPREVDHEYSGDESNRIRQQNSQVQGKELCLVEEQKQNIIMDIDYECWMIVKNGPVMVKQINSSGVVHVKKESKYINTVYKALEKNAKAMSILQQAIAENETNRISACQSAKEIWDTLELAYEGTSEVKRSKIDLLMSKYEAFNMKKTRI